MKNKMDSYVSALKETKVLMEAVDTDTAILADNFARVFLGDFEVGMKAIHKLMPKWKERNLPDYNNDADFNKDFKRLNSMFLKMLKSV